MQVFFFLVCVYVILAESVLAAPDDILVPPLTPVAVLFQ